MSKTDPAMDELNTIKARCTGVAPDRENISNIKVERPNRLFAPAYWRFSAIALAIFCGVFLFLSYKEISNIEQRKATLSILEERLNGGTERLKELSLSIGEMTAQRSALQGEILKLESEAANNVYSAAEQRLLSNTLPPLQEEHKQLLSKVATLREQKLELEKDVTNVQAKQADTYAAFEKRSDGLKALDKEFEKRSNEVAGIVKRLAEEQAAVAGAVRLHADYQAQIEKGSYENYQKNSNKLQDQLATLEKLIAERETKITSLRETSTKDEVKKDSLNDELSKVTQQIAKVQNEVIEFEKRKQSLANEIASLETERKQMDGLTIKIVAAKKEMVLVENALLSQNIKAEELNQKILQAEKHLIDREAAVGNIETKMIELESERIELIKVVSRLQGQHEALKKEISVGTAE